MIQNTWGRLKIDAFAAQHNNQLPVYWSLSEELKAAAVDALTTVATNWNVCLSTMENDSTGTKIDQRPKAEESSPDNTDMAKPILVSNGAKNETLSITYSLENQSEMEFNRLAIINHKRMQDGIDAKTSEFLNKKIRPSTNKAYDNGWKHWVTWFFMSQPKLLYQPSQYLTLIYSIRPINIASIRNGNRRANEDFFASKRRSEDQGKAADNQRQRLRG
ncbi:hypothetical protein [Parasitella parasitica]|uniref:Uncharacterized protein n=1 Tax=Parasitella parasitica TaxID=35722 RepID=A0A0B7MM65_9FUNG|nr:hypothetical protein [Parasitella parasitica]